MGISGFESVFCRVAIFALVVLGAPFASAQNVTVTGMNLQIRYEGSEQGYFGPTQQGVAADQILTLQGGQQFIDSITLTESPSAFDNHSLNNVAVTTQGFTLVSIDPTLPITFSPGSSARITMTFQAPDSDFTGAITVTFTTT
jgi:hypothetical protein